MAALSHYFHIFTALFVIVDPIGAIPFFIALTVGQTPDQRRATARITAVAVGSVLISSIFFGDGLLRFFGVGIPAFRVAGGVLIMLMAISMLNARPGRTRQTSEEVHEAEGRESVAVVPLAIPMLAGPGAISSTIIYAQRAQGIWEMVTLVLAALLVAVGVAAALYLADPIARRLGHTGINIATRIMGLIVAAVGVEFIAGGLLQLFPKLA